MAWKKNLTRYAKKAGKYVVKQAKKRYVNKRGNLKVGRMVKDIAMLKKMVNAEKKRIEMYNGYIEGVSQFVCNSAGTNLDTGYIIKDITPIISQGTTYSTRSGSSVKLHSMQAQFQLNQQANAVSPTTISVEFWRVRNQVVTANATTMGQIYDKNAISFFTDYHSTRNPDHFKDYQLIAKKRVRFEQDSISGIQNIKDFRIPRRLFNHHVRYAGDSNTVTEGQILLVVRASTGNKGSATATIGFLGSTPPVLTNVSGINVTMALRYYYYDN